MGIKLTPSHLRKIISEEISSINEQADLAAEGSVFAEANKLLIAIDNFKKKANPNMLSAIKADVARLEKHLSNMKLSPAQYVVATKTNKVKKVTMKPVKTDDVILLPIQIYFQY